MYTTFFSYNTIHTHIYIYIDIEKGLTPTCTPQRPKLRWRVAAHDQPSLDAGTLHRHWWRTKSATHRCPVLKWIRFFSWVHLQTTQFWLKSTNPPKKYIYIITYILYIFMYIYIYVTPGFAKKHMVLNMWFHPLLSHNFWWGLI